MTCSIYNKNRLALLDLLPVDWAKRIENNLRKKDPEAIFPTILPDESTILAGSDQQAIRALKRNGLYSPELKNYMEGRRSE